MAVKTRERERERERGCCVCTVSVNEKQNTSLADSEDVIDGRSNSSQKNDVVDLSLHDSNAGNYFTVVPSVVLYFSRIIGDADLYGVDIGLDICRTVSLPAVIYNNRSGI